MSVYVTNLGQGLAIHLEALGISRGCLQIFFRQIVTRDIDSGVNGGVINTFRVHGNRPVQKV
jgi:hypothetical protein